jgi:hypothetical protein
MTMDPKDYKQFSVMLDAACSLLSRGAYTPNAASTAIFFRALQAYPLEVVSRAFDAHCADPQRGKFVPAPADILAQIEGLAAQDGRPGPEEAWAMCQAAADEARTVVWTEEMRQAWSIVWPLIRQSGDEIGARMAFKEAYPRLVSEARARREPARWSTSLGADPAWRDEALRVAIEAGRLRLQALPDELRDRMLTPPAPSKPVGLIEVVKTASNVPQKILDQVARLRIAETPLQQATRLARERDAELKQQSESKVSQADREMAREARRKAAKEQAAQSRVIHAMRASSGVWGGL